MRTKISSRRRPRERHLRAQSMGGTREDFCGQLGTNEKPAKRRDGQKMKEKVKINPNSDDKKNDNAFHCHTSTLSFVKTKKI